MIISDYDKYSDYNCPSGFELNIQSVTVTSTNDLVVRRGGGAYKGAVCYGKN